MGSRALGICIRRHRGHLSQQALADMVDRSRRWMACIEAGKTDLGCGELVAIAAALGPGGGRAFLEDALALLYQEAEVEGVTGLTRDALAAVQRRAFLGVIGAGALLDLERIDRALQGLGMDGKTASEMNAFTQFCAHEARALGPRALASGLQAHLRNYLDLIAKVPGSLARELTTGAAETALLTGVLSLRMDCLAQAQQYWLLANGLAIECGHDLVGAFVLAGRKLAHSPAGGYGGNPKLALSLSEQALATFKGRVSGVSAVTLYSWRAVDHATLGNAAAAERDLEKAGQALSKLSSSEDLTGLGARSELELGVERMICDLNLQQPRRVLGALDWEAVKHHPSAGWRAARLSELGAACIQLGDVDHGISVLSEAADLALAAADPWRIRWVQGIRKRWIPAGVSSEALQELDRKLSARGPASGVQP